MCAFQTEEEGTVMRDKKTNRVLRPVVVGGMCALALGVVVGQRVSANHEDCYDRFDCEIGSSNCPECSSTPAGNCGYQFWGEPFQSFIHEVGRREGFKNWAGYEYQLCYTYRHCKTTEDECQDDERLVECEEDPEAEFGYFSSPSNLLLWNEC